MVLLSLSFPLFPSLDQPAGQLVPPGNLTAMNKKDFHEVPEFATSNINIIGKGAPTWATQELLPVLELQSELATACH